MIEVNLFTIVVFLIAMYCVVKSAVENGIRDYEKAKQNEELTQEEV